MTAAIIWGALAPSRAWPLACRLWPFQGFPVAKMGRSWPRCVALWRERPANPQYDPTGGSFEHIGFTVFGSPGLWHLTVSQAPRHSQGVLRAHSLSRSKERPVWVAQGWCHYVYGCWVGVRRSLDVGLASGYLSQAGRSGLGAARASAPAYPRLAGCAAALNQYAQHTAACR